MPHAEYPFYNFRTAAGELVDLPRVYLPIRLSNPVTGKYSDIEMALVDTGADTSVIPASLAVKLGHRLRHKKVDSKTTFGINGNLKPIDVYAHTFCLELLASDTYEVVWSNKNVLIDCIETEIPILLGTQDFLSNFKIIIDYPAKNTMLQW